jgi:chorismate dehydratase
MDRSKAPLLLGSVPYQVGAPLLEGLETHPEVKLRRQIPTELIKSLRNGQIEGALVSSIEAFRTKGLLALRNLGIACDGKVASVRLFCRTAPQDVKSLALDSSSATSVALCKILLQKQFGAQIKTETRISPTLQPDTINADAVLLIGDSGVAAKSQRPYILDLGEEWAHWKGLPFVFALWLFRTTKERAIRASAILQICRENARLHSTSDGTGGKIRHDLNPRFLAGLAAFHQEAASLGLCDASIEPIWVDPERCG